MAKTTDDLLESVKLRVSLPIGMISDADILKLADDVISGTICPIFIGLRQEFFVTTSLVTVVSGVDTYRVPYRALGRTLRDIKLKDTAATLTRDLAKLDPEDCHLFPVGVSPHSFYFKGDSVVLVPMPSGSYFQIEFWWECPPSKLAAVSNSGVVTNISGDMVTVGSIPANIITGVSVDFIEGRSGNSLLGMDATVTNVSSNTMTFATDVVPDALALGDYVSLAATAPVVQLPDEVFSFLVTKTGRRALQAIGDYEGYNAMNEDESDELKNLKLLLEPRIQGEPTKIINRRSLLRGVRNRYRRGLIY